MNRLSKTLTWLGVLPFVAGVFIYQWPVLLSGLSGDALFIFYSASILSFMAGTLWGKSHHNREINHKHTVIWSNLWALLSCLSLITFWISQTAPLSLIIQLLGYLHILFVEHDHQLSVSPEDPSVNDEYLSVRIKVTGVVIGLHILMLFLHILGMDSI